MGWTPDTGPNHNDPKEIIMATAELRAQSAPANPVRSINTDELESAICDMEVALALTAAIDNFLDQIRAWTRNSDLPREAQNAQVLLSELTDRSEEHTSELQSLMRISYAVFCLNTKTNPNLKPTSN